MSVIDVVLNLRSPVFTLLVTDAGQSGLSKAGLGLGGRSRGRGTAALGSELLLALVKKGVVVWKEARRGRWVEGWRDGGRGPVSRGNIHSRSVAEER